MPTMEVARLPLVAGSEIGEPNNPAAQVLKDCGGTLTQTDGMQKMDFGMEIENPNTLQLMINWDSKSHHETFIASDPYQPFLKKFQSIIDSKPNFVHVDFNTPAGDLTSALSAPVTEVATLYYGESGPPSNAVESTTEFIEACMREEPDVNWHGWAYGLTHEEVEKEGEGKGKAAVLLIGWDSVEAHMEFRKKKVFIENREKLAQGCKGIEVHHTTFMSFVE